MRTLLKRTQVGSLIVSDSREMAEALLLSGQRVVPDKIRRLGYIFHFDSLDAALRDLFP